MAVPFSNTKLRVPRGFQNILEGLAREVLRSQPRDVYAFGAVYFERLLKNCKDGTALDPAVHGAQMEDRFYNNKAFQKPDIDPSNPQQQDAALKIQTKYRQHHATQVVQEKREEAAATKIQAGFRGMHDRNALKEQQAGTADSAEVVDKSAPEEEEIDIDLNDPEVEAAAAKIQAGFKGYKARKELQPAKESPTETVAKQPNLPGNTVGIEEEEVDIDLNDPEVEKAALKIQAGFKGFKTRKKKEATPANDPDPTPAQEVTEKGAEPEEVIDIDLNDPETEKAALKIQAGFKGYKTRKDMKQDTAKNEATEDATPPSGETAVIKETEQAEEEIDIDLDDPETEKAALKIQAGFKGLQARREVKKMKESKEDVSAATETSQPAETEPAAVETVTEQQQGEEEEIDIDLNDPETEKAALKIQAGFKGYKVRKQKEASKEEVTSAEPEETSKTDEAVGEKTEDAPAAETAQTDATATGESEATPATDAAPAATTSQEEEIDIDLNDPETEKAALKIQAGFKGLKVRKEMKSKKETADGGATTGETGEAATTGEAESTNQAPAAEKPATEQTETATEQTETATEQTEAATEQTQAATEQTQAATEQDEGQKQE